MISWRKFRRVILAGFVISLIGIILSESIQNSNPEPTYSFSIPCLGRKSSSISPSVRINTTNTLIWNLTGHTSEVWCLSFNPNNQLIASASSDNLIKLWNISTGHLIRDLTGHVDSVYSVAFHPEGRILASGSFDSNVLLWNITTGEVIANLSEHTSAVWSLNFSSNGELLASGSNDNTIKLWNISDNNVLLNLTGHTDSVRTVAFSPDGQILASGSYDNSIKFWNLTTGNIIKSLENHSDNVVSLAFSPDGQKLASGSYDQLINIWDVPTGDVLRTYVGHESLVRTVAFNPDGETLASGSYDNTIKFWDTTNGVLLGNLTAHSASILSLVFDSTGQILASSSIDRTVKLWNITDIDSDNIPDWWERLYNLDPGDSSDRLEDPDSDDLVNAGEYEFGTNPQIEDTDLDLIPDGYEYVNQLNGTLNDAADDLDQDGIPNLYEYENGLLVGTNDAAEDTDGDGMPNLYEYQNGLLAGLDDDAYYDPDNDSLPNIYEYQNNFIIGIDDSSDDPDDDGLSNAEEYHIGTNPRNSDTDGDGWSDGIEKQWGTNPLNSNLNPSVLIILFIFGIIIIGVSSFGIIKFRSQIRSKLVVAGTNLRRNIFPQPEASSWILDLEMGKAIPINLLTKTFDKASLDIPQIVKKELTAQQLSGKTVIMRSQMLLLEPTPPQGGNCQICMSEIVEPNYFQCSQCQRYICVNDYVDLQGVGRTGCPNCSGDLVIFPFTCSACKLDFSTIKELSSKSRCPLCGYTLPDQSIVTSDIIKDMKPSQMAQELKKESEQPVGDQEKGSTKPKP